MPWRAAAANIDCSEAIVGGTPPPPVVAPRSSAASDLAEPAPCRRSTSRRSCSLLSLESLSESCRVCLRRNKKKTNHVDPDEGAKGEVETSEPKTKYQFTHLGQIQIDDLGAGAHFRSGLGHQLAGLVHREQLAVDAKVALFLRLPVDGRRRWRRALFDHRGRPGGDGWGRSVVLRNRRRVGGRRDIVIVVTAAVVVVDDEFAAEQVVAIFLLDQFAALIGGA